ncbi:peptidoglycan DD-metalloendopeptidase family protein [Silanimonas sp.]|jgi:lipoprotein NlpD|uniref:peptidoglycan DD-metalloendopeptidase family protein n=1 Tax=Silanimonas sp. TaxID=1929290 RepID=UPI0022C198F8|nr:peptidoglycan DD-metalloendopeptidase family protein [Silanimonas sp.]MCZ8114904.1 peptidoglycan DD-metalloendopeptidase family protein [Silanimonas sp.]
MRNRNPAIAALRGIALSAVALLLAACASTTVVREEAAPRPIYTDSRPVRAAASTAPRGPSHVVQAGDTLYGIAFRNSLDWREVARWNGIGEPFVIKPGQVLRLSAPRREATGARVASAPSGTPTPPASAPAVASGPPPIPRGPAGSSGPVARSTPPAPAPVARPVTAPTPANPPTPTPTTPVASATPTSTSVPPSSPGPRPPAAVAAPAPVPASTPTGPAGTGAFRAGQWQWPTQGQVISRYAEGDKARQGIAIAGSAGQPVRAAAAGTVVYSGAGLVGYGELIIIKHNDEWLSAYGHNRRRLVAEGANISAGQQIAELGRTGTSRDMLHFEIRRNGKPVDPTPLLPRR